jgi:hypothetical protein
MESIGWLPAAFLPPWRLDANGFSRGVRGPTNGNPVVPIRQPGLKAIKKCFLTGIIPDKYLKNFGGFVKNPICKTAKYFQGRRGLTV